MTLQKQAEISADRLLEGRATAHDRMIIRINRYNCECQILCVQPDAVIATCDYLIGRLQAIKERAVEADYEK